MTPTVVAPAPGAESDAGADPALSGDETAGLQAARTARAAATSATRAVRVMRMVILPSRGAGGRQVVRLLSNTLSSSSGAASMVRRPRMASTTRVRTNGTALSANWFTAKPDVC